MRIKIFCPLGSCPFTAHVDQADIQQHIAANSEYSHEARLLKDFCNGKDDETSDKWKAVSTGIDGDGNPWTEYDVIDS